VERRRFVLYMVLCERVSERGGDNQSVVDAACVLCPRGLSGGLHTMGDML
jgi:hypothetical protein